MTFSKKTAAAMTALGAVTAAIALAAPTAGAAVTRIDVSPGLSFGSSNSFGTGCSYTVTATARPGIAVVFLDEVDGLRTTDTLKPVGPVADANGKASTTWTPAKKGEHKLWAAEYISGETYFLTTVTVGTGVNAGPACVVLP
ncbi:hypothetical protein DFR70_110156 [Nocardia tenerifensis]|uniref:Ig-like domain-containing protein n=1 Tax=Nocardia tenerifensis TaxID=228006 RepID=A0A318JZZ4_9NOCA|nr:hypothetical protein [Nocardia tenerifensis]PXX60316.1 hypothetical protein DFR70_110156 [Nocardia tenerifensis]